MARLKTLLQRYFFVFDEPIHRWLLLLCAFIVTALLDVVGIGAIGLFMQAVVAPEGMAKLTFLPAALRERWSAETGDHIVVIGAVSMVFFTLRTLLAYGLELYTHYFNNLKQINIQRRLFYSYLHAPLLFRKKSSLSRMIYTVNFLAVQFIYSFSKSLFSFVSNLVLFLLMIAFLAIAHFAATAAILLVVLVASLLYYYIIRDRSARYGRLWAKANELQIKNMREGIGALDEIQALGCQDFFQRRVSANLRNTFRYRIKASMLNMIPRPLGEFLLLSFIVTFTIGYHLLVGDLTQITALLGIFALAGLRLVPAASHMSADLNGLKNSSYAVHQLYEEMRALSAEGILLREGDKPGRPAGALRFTESVELVNVSFTYPAAHLAVLRGINLAIRKGERVAIVGKSGSGKTTLINIILGYLAPDTGELRVDGVPIRGAALEAWRAKTIYLPQSIYLLDASIRENIAFGVEDGAIDEARLQQAIAGAQLAEFVASLPDGARTILGEQGARLSGGQRQRIGIARALYHCRELIVMDEATSALDEETETEVKRAIQNLPADVTVIMITHNLRSEDIFDRVIRLG